MNRPVTEARGHQMKLCVRINHFLYRDRLIPSASFYLLLPLSLKNKPSARNREVDDTEGEVSFSVSEAEVYLPETLIIERRRTVCRGLIESSVLGSFGFRQPAGAS